MRYLPIFCKTLFLRNTPNPRVSNSATLSITTPRAMLTGSPRRAGKRVLDGIAALRIITYKKLTSPWCQGNGPGQNNERGARHSGRYRRRQ